MRIGGENEYIMIFPHDYVLRKQIFFKNFILPPPTFHTITFYGNRPQRGFCILAGVTSFHTITFYGNWTLHTATLC